MKRLYIVVEGQTEQEFVNSLIAPYLQEFEIYSVTPVLIRTSRSGRGGMVNYQHLYNTIKMLLASSQTDFAVTTLIDFFRLPNDMPNYAESMAITDKTRAVIVVHLFGQAADMEPILSIASKHHLYVVEDNAQSLGATYTFADGTTQRAGTIGHIGTTSFFPSKPLACYGDGGALMTRDNLLADRIRMIANHGQTTKYNHQSIGCNSRLDTLQAAVLDVKLRHLDEFTAARQSAAHLYDELLASCAPKLLLPLRTTSSTHVFHQYTVQIKDGRRDEVRLKLRERGIPSMVYYPLPVHRQAAYRTLVRCSGTLPVATALCESVLSLPIHTEMTPEMVQYIAENLVEIVK